METKKGAQIKAIIALANEGDKYSKTYHNAGVFFIKEFKKINVESGDLYPVFFFVPSGFMNQIGLPIAKFLKMKNIHPEETLIIHDDSDQTIGNYKIVFAGSSGGHKGVDSTINGLKTNEFYRLKIGVRPTEEIIRKKAGDFILKKWTSKEESIFFSLAIESWEELTALLSNQRLN